VPGNLIQIGHKPTHLLHHLQKTGHPKPRNFFHCRLTNLPHLLKVWTAF